MTPPRQAQATDGTLKRALAAVQQFRNRIDALELAKRESIAIVGIGCRLPGGISSAADLWDALEKGFDAISPIPADRWDAAAYYDPDPQTPGRMPVRFGAFLDAVDHFDPYFFGISPREAVRMDPQQRLFLEVAWEALEDAGLTRDRLRGSATGVFVGANSSDYLHLQMEEPDGADTYTVVGGANCIISNRLSYLLDLRGPSMTLDTACSSSLVAVHLAAQSLRNRECDLAVVGGANLILSPTMTVAHAKGLPLSPDGRCRTFDARADGYARGEGVASIVLKRLSDAIADGDAVWAVVNGSAVNQDGLTNGLTAPSGRSQRAVISQALENSRLTPDRVTLVEAHGTGTVLGDPIEVEALCSVYGARDAESAPCALSSIKTNIGHLEAGAGLAGLIKAALSIHHRVLVPHLYLEQINPHISLDGTRLFIPTTRQDWDVPDERRHAAVSSFGAGGTNAHVVLGPAPRVEHDEADQADHADQAGPGPAGQLEPRPRSRPRVIPISAATSQALTAMAEAYRDHLAALDPRAVPLSTLAHTATVRRTQLEHRLTVVADSAAQGADRLTQWLDGEAPVGVRTGRASADVGRGVAFVFPGQGAQRLGMGRELMASCPVFRSAVRECDEAMRTWLDRSILDEIHDPDPDAALERIDTIQPALFAIAVGLAARTRALGIEPTAVIGHSMGEIAAAYVAGALSLEDATRISCRRSTLLRRISKQGAMLVVALPIDAVDTYISDLSDLVSAAVSNSPTSTVLSGDPRALDALAERLQAENIFCRPVKVDIASHSPQVDPLREELLAELADIKPRPSRIPILSTVTGELCDGSGFDAEYWWRNLRQPVLFWDGVRQLIDAGHGIFVEMSPHPALLSAVEQAFEVSGRSGLAVPGMRRDQPETHGVAELFGALHAQGVPAPLANLLPASAPATRLPGYAWQHESFWFRQLGAYRAPSGRVGTVPTTVPAKRIPARTVRSAAVPAAVPAAGPTGMYDLVLAAVAEVLEMDPDRIEPSAGFFQLGMDSIMAARVRGRLEAALDRKLPAPVMFEHPTTAELAEHLGTLGVPASNPDTAPATPTTPIPTAEPPTDHPDPQPGGPRAVDDLTEEQLLAVLADEIRMANSDPGEDR
ncbi:acyltransferase domain-containing protein [Catenulispora sp. NL8]|uniref:Acyltransferase domain-containing protein n=1 Tax=Catenulispora pinistramenti TaxID=2705254 RepID=A0ABS5KTM9_9ACTN|nr:type I polyketide synthase [Catenulispora pinistramenti]MBS2549393.1 acyltransferase domain-containing protein [Catenulispora pinistramenti]